MDRVVQQNAANSEESANAEKLIPAEHNELKEF
jgi:hypothetical protein